MAANPYVQGWRQWDERYADLAIGKRNWQIAAGGLLALSLILAGGMVWLASRSRYIPYVVEVDRLGYALTVPQPLQPAAEPATVERMERHEVAAFIREARAVSSDPQVEQYMLDTLLAHARGAADRFLDEYYHSDEAAHNPFAIAQKQTVTVAIDSILRLSAKSYEVRWTEVRRDLSGAAVGLPTHWEAQLQTEIAPPRDGAAILSNPLGFYVTNITWTEEQG